MSYGVPGFYSLPIGNMQVSCLNGEKKKEKKEDKKDERSTALTSGLGGAE